MAEDVEVEIFGQIFRVASGDATPAYIQRLAYYVDEKMRAHCLCHENHAPESHGHLNRSEYR